MTTFINGDYWYLFCLDGIYYCYLKHKYSARDAYKLFHRELRVRHKGVPYLITTFKEV